MNTVHALAALERVRRINPKSSLAIARELTVSKSASADNEIQAITGATITSKAVTRCVNLASKIVTEVKGGAN